jgi:ABC-type multidrug transport system fused ATPase/permease subunit
MSKLEEQRYSTKGALIPFMKRLIKYSWKYKPWVIGFIVFVCVVAAAEALLPITWKYFLDDVVVPAVGTA